jgi:DNA primase catalytic subunit
MADSEILKKLFLNYYEFKEIFPSDTSQTTNPTRTTTLQPFSEALLYLKSGY